jgi:cation transport ATPase/HAMP domain-containing protein
VVALGILGGAALSAALLKRVETIRSTAEAIIAGDLTRRVPVGGKGDDLDRLSQTINRMLDRMAELMESLREVSVNIAHDLKTPLARLRQRLEAAQAQSPDDRKAALEASTAHVDEILATFSALLRIAQIEAGTRRAGFAVVDLSDVFATVAEAFTPAAEDAGLTLVHVARAGKLIGLITIADAPRPTAAQTVAKLRERGVQVAMLTGDNAGTAQRIARELGIDTMLADVLPGQKAGKIKELQAQGRKVGMVGDGINDAPALTQADVGFAIGAGTDVAIESADVVLMKNDPYDIVGAVELSSATLRKMHQNLWWAVGYNVIAFPLAAGVLYPVLLSPEIAAFAMSGSTLAVAINARMLKRTRLAGITRSGTHQPTLRGAPATGVQS